MYWHKLIISIFANMNWHNMNKKPTFLQTTFWTGDDENFQSYLVIFEIKDGIPASPMIAKIPKTPIHSSRYPYILN
jgi:hypothetical protein